MSDKTVSIKKELILIIRGLKIIQNMMPSYILLMLLTSIITAITPYVNLYFSAKIIDEIVGDRNVENLITYVACLVVIGFILRVLFQVLFANIRVNELVFSSWEEFYLNRKSFKLDYTYLENHTIRALRQKIIDNREMGGLNVLLQSVLWLFRSIISLIIALIMLPRMFAVSIHNADNSILSWINAPASAILFVAILIALLFAITRKNQKSRLKQYYLSNELSKTQKLSHFYMDEYFDDTKSGKDIRLYKQNELIMLSLKIAFNSYLLQYRDLQNQVFSTIRSENIVTSLLDGLVYIFVGLKTLSGALSAGSLIEYSGIIRNTLRSILSITSIVGKLKSNNRYLEDLYNYLDLNESDNEKENSNRKPIPNSDSLYFGFEMLNVSFRYPGTETIALKNISIKINQGEKLAIVGKNGSGKTTFVKLLCGLYDPTEGTLLANGLDKREYKYSEYLDLFSVVFQDFKLFSFSLGQNVGSELQYDKARVLSALETAGMIKRVNEFSEGLETSLYKDFDENGVEISGGEAQKIAIARAFYKDSPVLIFDEPTAALDPAAESEIYNRLSETTDDKTTIFISHRLSSCRFCDRIIVFDKGEIVQDGSHEQLLANGEGVYSKLWNAQAQYYIDTGVVV